MRPPGGLGYLKVIILGADLALVFLPVLMAAPHIGGVVVAIIVMVCLAAIVAFTFFGWLGLDMRVEVEPDAVRIHYFKPSPIVIPRETIADVKIPLTGRSEAQGNEQAAKLRAALCEVAAA